MPWCDLRGNSSEVPSLNTFLEGSLRRVKNVFKKLNPLYGMAASLSIRYIWVLVAAVSNIDSWEGVPPCNYRGRFCFRLFVRGYPWMSGIIASRLEGMAVVDYYK